MSPKGAALKRMAASMRSTADGVSAGDEPTGEGKRQVKPKMVRKVPQRDGLRSVAKELAKRFGG